MRVIIEIIPEKWIMLDSDKMAKDTAGELTDEERGPLLESDAEAYGRRNAPPRYFLKEPQR